MTQVIRAPRVTRSFSGTDALQAVATSSIKPTNSRIVSVGTKNEAMTPPDPGTHRAARDPPHLFAVVKMMGDTVNCHYFNVEDDLMLMRRDFEPHQRFWQAGEIGHFAGKFER